MAHSRGYNFLQETRLIRGSNRSGYFFLAYRSKRLVALIPVYTLPTIHDKRYALGEQRAKRHQLHKCGKVEVKGE